MAAGLKWLLIRHQLHVLYKSTWRFCTADSCCGFFFHDHIVLVKLSRVFCLFGGLIFRHSFQKDIKERYLCPIFWNTFFLRLKYRFQKNIQSSLRLVYFFGFLYHCVGEHSSAINRVTSWSISIVKHVFIGDQLHPFLKSASVRPAHWTLKLKSETSIILKASQEFRGFGLSWHRDQVYM